MKTQAAKNAPGISIAAMPKRLLFRFLLGSFFLSGSFLCFGHAYHLLPLRSQPDGVTENACASFVHLDGHLWLRAQD
jgi:disulfide bond formation protein DsbB